MERDNANVSTGVSNAKILLFKGTVSVSIPYALPRIMISEADTLEIHVNRTDLTNTYLQPKCIKRNMFSPFACYMCYLKSQ